LKYLLILIVVVAVVWWLTRLRDRVPPPRGGRPAAGADDKPALMVRCEHCGLHLPRDEALPGAEAGFYCSDAHRRLGPTRPS
jgi:uncharacterized protein